MTTTRISNAPPPTAKPPAGPSASDTPSTSRQKRPSRSQGDSPLSPTRSGAPKSAGGSAAPRIRITHTRVFDDDSMSVKVSEMPVPAEGTHVADPRKEAALVGVVTSTVEKMEAGDVHARLPEVLDRTLATGHWMSDSHFHPTNYVQQGMTPEQLLAMMDKVGIHRSVISPIPTDCKPCGHDGDHNNIPAESYYVPKKFANLLPHQLTAKVEAQIAKSAHLSVNEQVDADTAMFLDIAKLNQAQRDRLDPMITGLDLGSPLAPQAMLFKLAKDKGMFTGVGEITIHKELVQSQYDGHRQANLTNNVQCFKNIVATAGVVGMPVVLHCDVDSTKNQRAKGRGKPEHLDNLKKLFSSPETRNTTLIWAHCGGVGRFVQKPIDHANNLRTILADAEMEHIHIDISWSRVARQIVMKTAPDGTEVPDPESVKAWAQLINDYPNRFLFGSDALDPQKQETWEETGVLYKPLLDALTPTALIAVKTGNYDRLLVGAREKVRTFEEHVLTKPFMERLRGSGEGRINEGPHINPEALRKVRDEMYTAAGVEVPARRPETKEQIHAHLTNIKTQRDQKLAELMAPPKKKASGLRRLFGAK